MDIFNGLTVLKGTALVLILLGVVMTIIMAVFVGKVGRRYGKSGDSAFTALHTLFSQGEREKRTQEKGEDSSPLFKDK